MSLIHWRWLLGFQRLQSVENPHRVCVSNFIHPSLAVVVVVVLLPFVTSTQKYP